MPASLCDSRFAWRDAGMVALRYIKTYPFNTSKVNL